MPGFIPDVASMLANDLFDQVQPQAYAISRNHLLGAATQLSPYFTHGLLTPRAAYEALNQRCPLHPQHKLVFEFGWRAYFRHVWAHLGDGIFNASKKSNG